MKNRVWFASLSDEEMAAKIVWLVRDYALRYSDERLAIIKWLGEEKRDYDNLCETCEIKPNCCWHKNCNEEIKADRIKQVASWRK